LPDGLSRNRKRRDFSERGRSRQHQVRPIQPCWWRNSPTFSAWNADVERFRKRVDEIARSHIRG